MTENPVTTAETARSILSEYYGLSAILTALDGDEDSNFLAEADSGEKYIFKIMHFGCREGAVALPCAALQHLEGLVAAEIPRVVPTLTGKFFESVPVQGVQRFIWLLSWCNGTLLADYSPHSESIYRSFGKLLAEIDLGLGDFRHPAMHTESCWQLTSAMDSAFKVDDIEGQTREIARRIFARFDAEVHRQLTDLPHGVIHNDANDYNVLVNISAGRAVVDSLFDFGDVAWQPVICDVAIALAYLILDEEKPLQVCASFLAAYSAIRPLSEPELDVLLDLISTRLAVSVAISSHRHKLEPDNQYIVNSQMSVKRAMTVLDKISPASAADLFRHACGLSI